jgi:hypothetical protein
MTGPCKGLRSLESPVFHCVPAWVIEGLVDTVALLGRACAGVHDHIVGDIPAHSKELRSILLCMLHHRELFMPCRLVNREGNVEGIAPGVDDQIITPTVGQRSLVKQATHGVSGVIACCEQIPRRGCSPFPACDRPRQLVCVRNSPSLPASPGLASIQARPAARM